MLDYRAEFDAEVAFDGGGELRARGFRLNIPHADVTDTEITALLVAMLAPQRVERAEVSGVRIFAEPHSPAGDPQAGRVRFVELSHVITAGMVTYPGLPAPEITPHLTRDASRGVYAPGTEFAIDRITMVGNTGTYLDSPFHRYADGADLAGLPLERLAGLPAVVVRAVGGERGVTAEMLAHVAVAGHAVLLHTGGDRHWGTPAYGVDAPYLTSDGAKLLADRGAALVGIDAVNIDDVSPAAAGERPVHSLLLAAGIPVVEHLTNLRELPPLGACFTAAPPRVAGFGTFPVRAFATVPADDLPGSAGDLSRCAG
ncbi:cyclase family protein [Actinoplanes sp. NEAU-A12]|uniref:Cyclase family protein n=1 Tax=Actinoplanes sandaracinus TaxID=3045177 RepID=A0ABT6WL53_9ACTN|nr:cyclase family protein [Actinoplanes sandaracinus]MDI6100472.1 cyclase family protein [Actinoplanes sandaracinus]